MSESSRESEQTFVKIYVPEWTCIHMVVLYAVLMIEIVLRSITRHVSCNYKKGRDEFKISYDYVAVALHELMK